MAVSPLTVSGQTDEVVGRRLDISLSGTWAGTAKLQRFMAGGWQDTGDSWTANAEVVAEAAGAVRWRIDWTRVSGSLVYEIRSEMIP